MTDESILEMKEYYNEYLSINILILKVSECLIQLIIWFFAFNNIFNIYTLCTVSKFDTKGVKKGSLQLELGHLNMNY